MCEYRYVCPNCNRTWLDSVKCFDLICYSCGDLAICCCDEMKFQQMELQEYPIPFDKDLGIQ
jgi:hypothetical protein